MAYYPGSFGNGRVTASDYKRCKRCGGSVQMPCRLCAVSTDKETDSVRTGIPRLGMGVTLSRYSKSFTVGGVR